jgi:hypothetical protein
MSRDVIQFADAVRGELRKEMNELADVLANGNATSYEEYKRICGVIHGLARAESYLLALREKVEKSDD